MATESNKEICLNFTIDYFNERLIVTQEKNFPIKEKKSKPYAIFDLEKKDIKKGIEIMQKNLLRKEDGVTIFCSYYSKFIKYCLITLSDAITEEILEGFSDFYTEHSDFLINYDDDDIKKEKICQLILKTFSKCDYKKENPLNEYQPKTLVFMKALNTHYNQKYEQQIVEMLAQFNKKLLNISENDKKEIMKQLFPIYCKVYHKLVKDGFNCFSFLLPKKINPKQADNDFFKQLDSYGIGNYITDIDKCACLYFNKPINDILKIFTPSVSIGKIRDLIKHNQEKQYFIEYLRVIKNIKNKTNISNVNFIYNSNTEKEFIQSYFNDKNIVDISETDKIDSKNDTIYLRDVNKRSCLNDENFYQMNFDSFQIMLYISFVRGEFDYNIKIDEIIKHLEEYSTNISAQSKNIFIALKEEIKQYIVQLLKKKIKYCQDNTAYLKEIRRIITNTVNFFIDLFNIISTEYTQNTNNNQQFWICIESDLNHNLLPEEIIHKVSKIEKKEIKKEEEKCKNSIQVDQLFFQIFQNSNIQLKFNKLFNMQFVINEFVEQTQYIIPSLFEVLNRKIIDYLILLFPNSTQFIKNMFELAQNNIIFPEKATFSTKICYLFLYISNNYKYFYLLDKLSNYSKDKTPIIKLPDSNQNKEGKNDVLKSVLQYIAQNNQKKAITALNSIELSSFKKFCNLASYLNKKLEFSIIEVFQVEIIQLIISYINDDKNIETIIKCLINPNSFSKTQLAIINNDEFNGKLLNLKYQMTIDNTIKKEILQISLTKREYLLNSKNILCNLVIQSIHLISITQKKDFSFDKILSNDLKAIEMSNPMVIHYILNIMQNQLYLYFINQLSITPNTVDETILENDQYIIYMNCFFDYLVEYKKGENKDIIKMLLSIAYLKVYLYFFYKFKDKAFDFSNISSFLMNQENEEIKKVLMLYILKNVRREVRSFKEFVNFNYINNQMLWISNLTFKDSSGSNFEYLFFSYMENVNYIEKYRNLEKIFNQLLTKLFRTNEYNQEILKYLCSNNERDLFIDLIFNTVYSQLISNKYKNQSLEFYEFLSWIVHLIKEEAIQKLDKRIVTYYTIIFNKIKLLTQFTNEDLNKIECILISQKMSILFLLLDSNKEIIIEEPKDYIEAYNINEIYEHTKLNIFNKVKGITYMYKTNEQKWKKVLSNEEVKKFEKEGYIQYDDKKTATQLSYLKPKGLYSKNIAFLKVLKKQNYTEDTIENISYKIVVFIIYSYYYYYQQVDNLKEEDQNLLKEVYDDIVLSLHVKGIKNEKIFFNMIYSNLKNSINSHYKVEDKKKDKTFFNNIKKEIETFIQTYLTTQTHYIDYMNKLMNINISELRNYILDQRVPNDIKDYPYFEYFYYTQYPSLEHFKAQFNSIYNKECKYPFINAFMNKQIDFFNIQKEQIDDLLKEMKSNMNDDSSIDYTITKKEYAYNGKYKSLEEIIISNSYNNIYKNDNTVLTFNGDIVVYDYMEIERELSTILY